MIAPRPALVRSAAAGLLLMAASCATVGPKTIPRDQFDYGAAIRNASKEQLLFNIVGMRYLDAPVFVDVSSVINQYSLEGAVDLSAGFSSGSGNEVFGVGGTARYADRPTITYMPVSGKNFAESLLTPISPANLFALVQAGWPPEFILRLAVRSINGIENEWASPAHRKPADPRFDKLLMVWTRLRKARAWGLRREGEGEKAQILMYQVPEALNPALQADLDFMHEALGLDPSLREFTLHYGLIADQPNEIVVLTSSILEIMNELAWRIDVPDEHVVEGRTGASFVGAHEQLGSLIEIHYATAPPENAYASVRRLDHWYYVDDRDMRSKRIFAMLQIMLSLTDTGEGARGPIVSITN